MAGLAERTVLCLGTSTVVQHLLEFMCPLSHPPSGTYLKQPRNMNAPFFLETSSLVPCRDSRPDLPLFSCHVVKPSSPLEQTRQDIKGLPTSLSSPHTSSSLSPPFKSSAVHLIISTPEPLVLEMFCLGGPGINLPSPEMDTAFLMDTAWGSDVVQSSQQNYATLLGSEVLKSMT